MNIERIEDVPMPPPQRKRKFYLEDVAEWRLFHARGWSYRQIGKEYGVCAATVCQAIKGNYAGNIVPREAGKG